LRKPGVRNDDDSHVLSSSSESWRN
jgi:hypothetical protein